ncbi:cupin-like domain-containing protein [Asticcacaulis sp. 201]|uniref:cupin-like domain-containing protein n=1 Tax=Asticcacaulis sp. 201 TaxID=3028787 RepID=UPI002916DB26|nr:cupin-like domain-containing protein [Asticcacaulis sp. 201]MDV6330345.1 cupin-like domain-containing protein [Asticcacaulis sp. 201]
MLPHVTPRIVENIDRATFDAEIRTAGQPVILKGIAANWPAVQAARESPRVLGDYLRRFDTGVQINVSVCPKEERGQFFYNDTLTGLNYQTHKRTLTFVVGWCLAMMGQTESESVYLQAQPVDDIAPAMATDLNMPLLDAKIRPRLWIGNTLRTQTHFDYTANIAVHIAGEKVFTLFAPHHTANLYPGPLDRTPAGVPISMASLENPDFDRFPRFAEALADRVVANLSPGDGLFIPPLWWHHVQTTGPLNMLVNYWWNDARPDLVDPIAALNIAALAYKNMPDAQRKAWREMMEFFVFENEGPPMAHLPIAVHGAFEQNISSYNLAQLKRFFLGGGNRF